MCQCFHSISLFFFLLLYTKLIIQRRANGEMRERERWLDNQLINFRHFFHRRTIRHLIDEKNLITTSRVTNGHVRAGYNDQCCWCCAIFSRFWTFSRRLNGSLRQRWRKTVSTDDKACKEQIYFSLAVDLKFLWSLATQKRRAKNWFPFLWW